MVRSVIMAMLSDTFAFDIPPIILLNKNIINTVEIDHTKYEIKVPVLKKIFLINIHREKLKLSKI